MKKHWKWLAPLAVLLALAAYCTLTPVGALRLAVLADGYPVRAFTLRISPERNWMDLKENQLGYSLENPPFEQDTQSELENWVVTRHGVFYSAQYYGWG